VTAPKVSPLTVILPRFKAGAPGGWPGSAILVPALARCSARPGTVGCGDNVRAAAAVARQGLRAAGGAQAPRLPRLMPAGLRAAAAPHLSQRSRRGASEVQRLRLHGALEDVENVLTDTRQEATRQEACPTLADG
jgi:hypothetical protein